MYRVKKILDNKLVRSIFLVASGTAGAQAITLLFAPVITRLFSPEAYGELGSFTALLMVLTPAAALTYPIAIVLPKDDSDAKTLARLSCYLTFLVSFLLSILIFILNKLSAKPFGFGLDPKILFFIPLAIVLSAFHQIFYQWLVRKRKFKNIAKTSILHSVGLNLSKTACGFSFPSGFALISIATIGHGFHAFLLWLSMRKDKDSLFKKEASRADPNNTARLKSLFLEYKDFPLYRAPQVIINAVSESIPILLLASLFGAASAGHFTLSKSIIMASVSLVAKSVSDVLYPKISNLVTNGTNPSSFIIKSSLAILSISILPASTVFLFGPEIFIFAFGEEWSEAGHHAKWIALWLLFYLAARPVVASIPVLGLQRLFLFHEIFFLFFKVAALYLSFLIFNSAQTTVFFYSIAALISYVVLFFLVYISLSNKKETMPS